MRALCWLNLAVFAAGWGAVAAHPLFHDVRHVECGDSEPGLRCGGCDDPAHHHHGGPGDAHHGAVCRICAAAVGLVTEVPSELLVESSNPGVEVLEEVLRAFEGRPSAPSRGPPEA